MAVRAESEGNNEGTGVGVALRVTVQSRGVQADGRARTQNHSNIKEPGNISRY